EKKLTKSLFEKYLKENHKEKFYDLRKQVFLWSKSIFLNEKKVYLDINIYLKELLMLFIEEKDFNTDNFESLFFSNEELDKQDFATISNSYSKDGITVLTDTIHGVKGETHTATLYLETFYKVNDIKRIMKFILKKNKKQPNIDEFKSLKMAYVGMSRATKLLCIALESESLSKKELVELYAMAEKDEIAIVRIC
ncbi:hypothetical protein, partial [Peribacillus frigoritolerans]|nr:hypothetical protein [Peribacillus castrilensis]